MKAGSKALAGRSLLAAAAFVVIVAGMRAASSLLLPLLLAVFFAVMLTPPLRWLQSRRVPTVVALGLIFAAVLLLLTAVVAVVGTSVNDFARKLPEYQVRLQRQIDEWEVRLQQLREDLTTWSDDSSIAADAIPDSDNGARDPFAADVDRTAPTIDLNEMLDPGSIIWMIRLLLSELTALLSNALLILITVIFMLLEASRLPDKLEAIMDPTGEGLKQIDTVVRSIRRYMAIKTCTSLVTGGLVFMLVSAAGIDYPLIWALIAFLFNYVPNIGSILAAIPAVILALLQSGWDTALIVAGGYLVINLTIGNFIEPRYMGRGLGLSTLVVFVSLIFWGWVLGPVGMLLSAPLTMIVKIVMDSFDDTRWIAVLLSSRAGPQT